MQENEKYKDITSERKIIVILLFVSIIMFLCGCYFLYEWYLNKSIIELIIAGSLVFICGYALIVFVKKLKEQCFFNKIEVAIEKRGIRAINQLAEMYKVSETQVKRAIKYLKDNNYLKPFYVVDNKIVSKEEVEKKKEEDEAIRQQLLKNIIDNTKTIAKNANKEISESCEQCGAIVKFNGDRGICPYCGSPVKKK